MRYEQAAAGVLGTTAPEKGSRGLHAGMVAVSRARIWPWTEKVR